MSEPYIGEIRMVGFNYAPRGWAFCQGQLLSIQQYTALFSLLGTTYGGNGQTTFGLPDLRGRVPTGTGTGPGLQPVDAGEVGGTPSVTLTNAQLPMHNHTAAFAGTPVAANTNMNIGCVSTAAIANPTNGATVYLTATAAEYGGDPVTLNGLYSSSAPTTGATATLAGGSISVTPQGNVTVGVAGASNPVSLYQPYTGINFIIALEGVFPSRN